MSKTAGTRDIEAPAWSRYPVAVERWAIVVGISHYAHSGWDLKYAHRDAETFDAMLRSPTGGAFDERHIVRLIDADATTRNITKALRSFLKKPKEEDLVILYFACHGASDPDRPDNVYLISHDTDPEDIAGTALPMREIDTALRENMKAERAVIFADTCHSGSLGGRFGRRGADDARIVSAYLQAASEAKGGIALVTAAQAGESSIEHERWGDGHGVFTHYLLEGMRGAADGAAGLPRDGIVTVRELFEYVRANVLRDTDDRQHPWLGPNPFDDRLPIAITGGASANEHFRVGLEIDHLARHLDDPRRFRAAAGQLAEAARLARAGGQDLIEARAACGLAWLDAGDHDRAVETLRECIDVDSSNVAPLARYHLGLALEQHGDSELAAQTLRSFANQFSQHAMASWARARAARIASSRAPQRRALLIASMLDNDAVATASATDVAMVRELLVATFGFPDDKIVALTGPAATRDGILDGLRALGQQSSASDDVVVYFSGHSVHRHDMPDAFLVTSGARFEAGSVDRLISATELHDAMQAVPAAAKWLILDTNGNDRFVDLVRADANYTLWSAAVPGQSAYVIKQRGAFTSSLIDAIKHAHALGTQAVHARVVRAVENYGITQRPLLAGALNPSIFGGGAPVAWLDAFARRFDQAATSREMLGFALRCAESLGAPFPELFRNLGLGLLDHAEWTDATAALRRARESGWVDPTMSMALGVGLAARGDFVAAEEALSGAGMVPDRAQTYLEDARGLVRAMRRAPIRAVIVGIDRYASLPPLQGAANDARAMGRILAESCRYMDNEAKILVDREATRMAILDALRALKELPPDAVTLFYFAGYGSNAQSSDQLTIVPVDGRGDGAFDLTFDELRNVIRNDGSGPITIFDVGWTFGAGKTVPSARVADADARSPELTRDITETRQTLPGHLGRRTIFNRSIRCSYTSSPPDLESPAPSPFGDDTAVCHGALTRSLVVALRERGLDQMTVRDLSRVEHAVCVPDAQTDALVFVRRPDALLAQLRSLRLLPVRDAAPILRGWVGRPGGIEQGGYFHLGLAHFVLGDHEAAIQAFRKERELEHSSIPPGELAYYLGRANLEHGAFGAAVSELEAATRIDPEFVPAHYYLGEAIRRLVQTQTLIQAAKAFERYLDGGAPHGRVDEVEAQLQAWRKQLALPDGQR